MLTVYTSAECGPCQIYKQELDGLENVTIIDVDDPSNFEQALAAQAWQVPTSVTHTGIRWTGVRSRAEVIALLNQE